MVFSAPSSMLHAWKLQAEPRYVDQWVRRNVRFQDPNAQTQGPEDLEPDLDRREDNDADRGDRGPHRHRRDPKSAGIHRDWGMSLSVNATVGNEMFPAKFTFDVNATPSCANDFVVFNTNVTPVAKDASTTGTFNGMPTNGQTATITNGANSEVLTASGADASGTITINSVPSAGDTVTVGSTTYTFDSNATGTITIGTVPNAGDTVVVGSTTYKLVTTLVNADDVLIVAGNTNETAENLQAAIVGDNGQCFSGPPCFGTGTTANASVTATLPNNSNVITVIAITPGTGGNTITFTTSSGGRITLSPTGGTLSGGAGGTLTTANEVASAGSTANTAQNLRAAIDGSNFQCFNSPCFGTGTVANASATATRNSNVVTVNAITWGTGGNTIALSTNDSSAITVSGSTLSGGITAINTGTNFALDGNTTDAATNLALAIVRNVGSVGVTATSSGNTVTVTATTAGSAGNNITVAKTLSNFTWTGTNLSGGVDAQPSIVAFNQLYSTQGSVGGLCNQNGPSLMWSYNTNPGGDTTGSNPTSPVLSSNGAMVAYVETRTNANGGAILHILKWKSGQGTVVSPATPDQVVSSWSSCTAGNSCIVNITFGNAQPDSNSSPFYNYSNDTLYVGDDNGALHKFTPVFAGTPAEVTASWPITVHSANVLSSPVFDSGSSNILVGDAGGQISYVRETGSTTGACSSGSAPCLGTPSISLTGSIVDGPLVDSSTQRAIWFDGQDTTNHGEVVQTDTALGNQKTLTGVGGSGSTPTSNMHVGAFDHTYLTSASNNIAGFLYFIGKNHGANRDHPSLWRVGFNTSGVMNTTPDGGVTAFLDLVNTSGEEASPVTELNNGSTDRIFFSVGNNSGICAANAGCMMSLTLGGTWPPTAVTNSIATPVGPNQTVSGGTVNQAGTSGIVVDNVSASSQASSIYYSYTGNSVANAQCNAVNGTGCAIKLTQSGLN